MFHVPRTLAAIVAAGALAVTGVTVAAASIPDSSGAINACYAVKDGSLRVIDPSAGQRCTSGQKPLSWSQTGPQGPAGPVGPQGPAGPPATAQDVTSQVTYTNLQPEGSGSSTELQVTLDCPSGTKALNGGISDLVTSSPDPGDYVAEPGSAVEHFAQNLPRPVNGGASWEMAVTGGQAAEAVIGSGPLQTPIPMTVTYYVICE
jgi:hypothetical protein